MKTLAQTLRKFENRENGFSLVEIIVSFAILAVLGLSVMKDVIHALHFSRFVEANHVASTLAISKMEEFAALDHSTIDETMNATETSVLWPGRQITFTRQSTITVNADNSRTVDIVVSCNHTSLATSVNFTTTFSVWE